METTSTLSCYKECSIPNKTCLRRQDVSYVLHDSLKGAMITNLPDFILNLS